MKLKTTVDGQTHWVEWVQQGLVRLDDREVAVDLVTVSDREVHLIHRGRSVTVERISGSDGEKELEVSVNGKKFRVSLEDRFDELLRTLGMENTGQARTTQVKAPMPGLVLDVLVAEGQEVEKDTPLVILEAMKMENVIKSPASGKIRSVPALKGKAVEKNSVLIEFH